MACASCHFSAGTDSRIRNQLSPGFNVEPTADDTFGAITDYDGEDVTLAVGAGETASGGEVDTLGSEYVMTPDDFPFHQLTDIGARNSNIEVTTNDVMSSAGSFDSTVAKVKAKNNQDECGEALADVFHAGGYASRMVEPRNTPTTINAVFNFVNFWDGRANNKFNGVSTFGPRDIENDPAARIAVLNGNKVELEAFELENASLASQAVTPVLSNTEMSCDQRSFHDVGKKLLLGARMPLQDQDVASTDSVFGTGNGPGGATLRNDSGLGLNVNYKTMIKNAFESKYWAASGSYEISPDGTLKKSGKGYSQMALNFTLFWGISIMAYEETLISDQSKFDDWFDSCDPTVNGVAGTAPVADPSVVCDGGLDPTTLVDGFGTDEVLGFGLFTLGGNPRAVGHPACSTCHARPLFSEAQFEEGETFVPVEYSFISDGPLSPFAVAGRDGGLHQRGFFNIGTRPTSFDKGNGRLDPYGDPLSAARMFLIEQSGGIAVDPTGIDRCDTPGLHEPGGTPALPGCNPIPFPGPPITPGWAVVPGTPLTPAQAADLRELVDGGFKTPTLRNIALTAPYFNYGGYSSLERVIEFYARGGSKRDKSLVVPPGTYNGDTSGTGPTGKDDIPVVPAAPDFHFGTNVDFFIRDLDSTPGQIAALTAFLKSLTDDRVRCDAAPFDHPSLVVTHGHLNADEDGDGKADDIECTIPAVGAAGYMDQDEIDPSPGAEWTSLCLPNEGDLFAEGMRNRLTGDDACRPAAP